MNAFSSMLEIPIDFRFADEQYNATEILQAHVGTIELISANDKFSSARRKPEQFLVQGSILKETFCIRLTKARHPRDLTELRYSYGTRQLSLRPRPTLELELDRSQRAAQQHPTYRMEPIQIFNEPAPNWGIVTQPKLLINERKNIEIQFDLLNETDSVIPAAEVSLHFYDSNMTCVSAGESAEFTVEIRNTKEGLRVFSGEKDQTVYERMLSFNTGGCGERFVSMSLGDTGPINPKSSRRITYEFVNTRTLESKDGADNKVPTTIGGFRIDANRASVSRVSAAQLASMNFLYVNFRGHVVPRSTNLKK